MVWSPAIFTGDVIRRGVAGVVHGVINTVLPPQCLACDALVATPGSLCAACWREAKFITAPQCTICGVPYSFDPGGAPGTDVVCGACVRHRPIYDRARAVLRYDDLGRRLVVGFKHGDRTHGAPTFGRWLARAGAELIAEADMVAPVPLHRLRLIRRRFNQSAMLAQAICRSPGGEGLQFAPDLLLRHRHTPSQAGLNAVERKRNVRNAFTVNERRVAQVDGKRVLLVDDVFTTGATVSECARILGRAGAASVDILTLARVDAPRGEP
ncbi:MAG: ComF family protein [Alphaproteobacteria bacterium]|nr:ComF family protein [Alphaproteobacteria bacterium]